MGLLLLLAFLVPGWLLARRQLPAGSASLRLAAAGTIAAAGAAVLFQVLLLLGLFPHAAPLALGVGALAVAATFRGSLPTLLGDLRAAASALRAIGTGAAGFVLALGSFLVGLRLLRALWAPPLAWDALTYHLDRAAAWVQGDRFPPAPAPDAWGYYAWFPRTGDGPWAWSLHAVPDGGGAAIVSGLLWALLGISTYAAARALGAAPRRAALAAGALAFLPAVANTAGSAYVDTPQLALLAAGVALLLGGAPLVAGLALGLAASIKISLFPVAAAALAIPLLRREVRSAARGAAGMLLPVALEYGPTWMAAGSPAWPFALQVGPWVLAGGNPELTGILAGTLPSLDLSGYGPLRWFWQLVLPWSGWGMAPLGWGLGGAVLAGAGARTLARGLRDRAARALAVWGLLAALLVVLTLASDSAVALRTVWSEYLGRFLAPALLAPALLLAREGREKALLLAVALGLPLLLPWGWVGADLVALGRLLGWSLPWGIGIGLLLSRGWRRTAAGVGAAFVLGTFLVAVPAVRGQARDRLWAAAGRAEGRQAYDLAALEPASVAWEVWKILDYGREERVVAVVPGWDGLGHRNYLFPLRGSGLQNRLVYVPPTEGGEVIDYREREALAGKARFRAWLARLVEREVDVVVALPPYGPEVEAWLEQAGDVFLPLARSRGGAAAWTVRRDAAREALHGGAKRGGEPGPSAGEAAQPPPAPR